MSFFCERKIFMKKPIIGVLPLVDSGRDSLWMLPGYFNGIIAAGGVPVMLPLSTDREILSQLADTYDGFLFTGGQDVSPALYGEDILPECGEISQPLDEMESILLTDLIRRDKPVLGICRGIQFINAALGGTLYQDIPSQKPSDTEHHQSPPYDIPIHSVTISGGTPLHALLDRSEIRVNSYHHQAVKKLSPKLLPMAYSEDGLVEGVYMPDKKYIMAVQWHPELSFLSDNNSMLIFRSFIEAC